MVIDYYTNEHPDKDQSLMFLLEKTVILILLATAMRPSELRGMSLNCYTKTKDSFVFTILHHTKTSRHNVPADRCITIKRFFKLSRQTCPYFTLEKYLRATRTMRKTEYVFVTTTTGTPAALGTIS